MKQLELNLNKRLLIVEYEDVEHLENVISCDKQGIRFCTDDDEPTKLICKGSDLTEDISKGLVERKKVYDTPEVYFFKNYKNEFSDCLTALQSFISAIESKCYHWVKATLENCQWKELQELNAKSRTFTPEKCIIFEIL